MRSNTVTVSSQAASVAIPINSGTIFNGVGLIATVSAGASLTYSVEISGDPEVPTNWNVHDVISAKSASTNSNIAFPVRWVRLKVTAWTSGSVTLCVVQTD